MDNVKCFKCDSKSVIQDGLVWTCFQHIEPCKCSQEHSDRYEWDFQKRPNGISYTIKAMESDVLATGSDEDTRYDEDIA